MLALAACVHATICSTMNPSPKTSVAIIQPPVERSPRDAATCATWNVASDTNKTSVDATSVSGKGGGAILNQDLTVNSSDRPATRGSTIVIYATGGGAMPGAVDGRLAQPPFQQLRQL